MTECIQIQWTCNSIEEARKVAHALVEKKLVACVNIIPQVESIYKWEDKIETDQEVEVLLKTREDLFEDVKKFIKDEASYAVPAILTFPILDGNEKYLDWVMQVVKD